MNIADLDFLTPGSIFTREDGRESRFLFLTNTALPKKVQQHYPPQVVYADENNNILSCDIDRFLNKRKFHMVDPELEARLENLLALSGSDSEDALDLDTDDALVIADSDDDLSVDVDDLDADSQSTTQSEFTESGDGASVPMVKFIPSSELPATIDAEYLAQAVSSYQQSPSSDRRSVQHALFIRAEAGITRESLLAAFSPSREQGGINSIYTFEVELEGVAVHVNWDEFLGVYPCVFYGSHMYQVIFSTFAKAVEPMNALAEIPVAVEEAEADAELAAILKETETVEFVSPQVQSVQVQPTVQALDDLVTPTPTLQVQATPQ